MVSPWKCRLVETGLIIPLVQGSSVCGDMVVHVCGACAVGAEIGERILQVENGKSPGGTQVGRFVAGSVGVAIADGAVCIRGVVGCEICLKNAVRLRRSTGSSTVLPAAGRGHLLSARTNPCVKLKTTTVTHKDIFIRRSLVFSSDVNVRLAIRIFSFDVL